MCDKLYCDSVSCKFNKHKSCLSLENVIIKNKICQTFCQDDEKLAQCMTCDYYEYKTLDGGGKAPYCAKKDDYINPLYSNSLCHSKFETITINLSNYINEDLKILSGRDNGIALRTKLNIDTLEKNNKIVFEIPCQIYSLNASFFIGLFGKSFETLSLSKEQFKEKFTFICDEVIMKNIDDGISRCLIK